MLKSHKDLAEKTRMAEFVKIQKLAAQGLFNTLKKEDIHFRIFLKRTGKFNTTIGKPNAFLVTDQVDKTHYGLAVEAIISFVNWRANKPARKLSNLADDIKRLDMLRRGIEDPKKDDYKKAKSSLQVSQNAFQSAFMASSIYLWRRSIIIKKQKVDPGAWADKRKPVTKKLRRMIR
jgi:hypothetical protein